MVATFGLPVLVRLPEHIGPSVRLPIDRRSKSRWNRPGSGSYGVMGLVGLFTSALAWNVQVGWEVHRAVGHVAAVLQGVGPNRAQAIVLYREKNGKFFAAEELSAVRGIGMATVKRNDAKIVLK